MTKEKMHLLIFLFIVILLIGLGSVLAISHFSKVNLKHKFVESRRITTDVLKVLGTNDNQYLYASYIKNERSFRNDFINSGMLNIDAKVPALPVSEYEKTYKNRGKNNSINTSVLGDYNFTTKNRITFFIKDYERVVYITVDINGYKSGPNVYGQDLFSFQLLNNGQLYPMGSQYTDFSKEKFSDLCSTTSYSKYNGITCAQEAVDSLENNTGYFNF